MSFCLENGISPKFIQFAFEEGYYNKETGNLTKDAWDHFENGYYKTLTDFRLYEADENGMLTDVYAPQQNVTQTYPENGEFAKLVRESLTESQEIAELMTEDQRSLFEDAKAIMERDKKVQAEKKAKAETKKQTNSGKMHNLKGEDVGFLTMTDNEIYDKMLNLELQKVKRRPRMQLMKSDESPKDLKHIKFVAPRLEIPMFSTKKSTSSEKESQTNLSKKEKLISQERH